MAQKAAGTATERPDRPAKPQQSASYGGDDVDIERPTGELSALPADHQAWLEIPRSDKISEKISRNILNDIVVRGLPVGSMLPSESVMLARYGVGRGSLREALRILEILGLIKIKPGPRGGPVVAQVTSSDLARSATFYFQAIGATFADLLNARLSIEPLMARLAAERLTDESARALTATLSDQGLATSDATGAWTRASAGFHVVVNGLSGNLILDLFCRALMDIYAERTRVHFPISERAIVYRAHSRIADAILARDPETAERRMRRHVETQITEMRSSRPELLDELIDWR